ncbi:bifunctional diguanylate cyclase/phosphodiesterase [Sphingomonas sp. Leaf22]|uniref:bifunctional diguanylate cyclase/phosphodiesterase n=1 Tax=Sphingomonas sp. Leaf22 TaxID=1735687 RepID=UPI0009EC711F|nr:bifunctional diguanylate cyclase/phosphodiesterase [Sphingomonas sp. Leaf22]
MARADSEHIPLVGPSGHGRGQRPLSPVAVRDGPVSARAVAPSAGYRFLFLAEIEDFAALRRQVGVVGAGAALADIVARLRAMIADSRITPVGRSGLEIKFERDSATAGNAVAERIRAAMAQPFDLNGESCRVTLRIGGVGARVREADEVRLIEAAELALVDGQQIGTDVVRDLSDPAAGHDPVQLMRDLPGAIEDGQIFLQYQPKVRVRQQCVASAEALVRWRHPTRGLVLPGDFIEAAERSHVIGALTLWTIRRVIADQRMLAAAGYDIPIFINMSGVLLSDPGFVREACRLVREGGARVGFEITETAVIRDPESAIANLRTFSEIGVPLAIDDYGAGLSSLAYLKRLPASELKIDKLFVTQLTSSNRDPLIVRSTIDLAHALDMEVTAEGVETPAALALLGVMGCDMVQGYLISRPIEFEAFRTFLREEGHLAAMASPRLSFLRNEGQWKTG